MDKLGIFHANQTSICHAPHQKLGCGWYLQTCLSKKDGNGHETIQSSTTTDQGYMGT